MSDYKVTVLGAGLAGCEAALWLAGKGVQVDRHGNWFELEAEGLLARCIQHENDHLDGITIMQSSEYFYEDTEEGKKAAREAKGNN